MVGTTRFLYIQLLMAKSFKLEIEYFGLTFNKELEKLEDILGITLSLGPFVKVGVRDLRPQATYHTTVGIHQQTPGDPRPPFQIPLDGGDGTLSLVPISMEIFGWRRITVNGQRATLNTASTSGATGTGIPPSVPGYDARRNVLLRLPDQDSANGTNRQPAPGQVAPPGSPDSGYGSSTSGTSDNGREMGYRGLPRPSFQRQVARRGRPRLSVAADAEKRPRQEESA